MLIDPEEYDRSTFRIDNGLTDDGQFFFLIFILKKLFVCGASICKETLTKFAKGTKKGYQNSELDLKILNMRTD